MNPQNIEIPEVGDIVTIRVYTDCYTADVISVTKSGKTATCRKRKANLVKPPVMVPGGFAGYVQEDAKWETESNPDGEIFKISLRNTGKWKVSGWPTRSPGMDARIRQDSHYYDYGF